MKKHFVFLLLMFLFVARVDAASLCTFQEEVELNQKAKNVKVSYEIEKEKVIVGIEDSGEEDAGTVEQDIFNINILNVTEEFYVVVKNDKNDKTATYRSSDAKDGIITFRHNDVSQVTNFTFTVYTSDKTKCPDETFNTLYLQTPKFNFFSNLVVCNELTDFFLCERYITIDNVDQAVFYSQLEKYKAGKINDKGEEVTTTNFFDRVILFFSQYGLYILAGIAVIGVAAFVIYRVTHRKQRELGL